MSTTSVLNGKATISSTDLINKNVKIEANGLFCLNGTTTVKMGPADCLASFYVIGGGGAGNSGAGPSNNPIMLGNVSVGRGGGCGAIGFGTARLLANQTYTVTVGAGGNAQSSIVMEKNGSESSFSGAGVSVNAPGGNNDGSESSNASGSGTGITDGGKFTSNKGDYSPDRGEFEGNGGVDRFVGATLIAGKGVYDEKDPLRIKGEDGITIGSGGAGGYGSSGMGGNGKSGAVILLTVDNMAEVKHIEYQLRDLNQLPGTKIDQYNQQFNATMMAGAMWTVLATSLVFYVFTQV